MASLFRPDEDDPRQRLCVYTDDDDPSGGLFAVADQRMSSAGPHAQVTSAETVYFTEDEAVWLRDSLTVLLASRGR
jgi:hypothetical protein